MLPQWTASFYPSLGLVVHRITKQLRLEEPSGATPPAPAGPPAAGCPGPSPDSF